MMYQYQTTWQRATAAAALMACVGLAWAGDKDAPDALSQTQATPAYKSVFADYRPAAEQKETPLQVWRAANDEMGRLKGHAGHLKDAPAAASPEAHGAHHPPVSKETK